MQYGNGHGLISTLFLVVITKMLRSNEEYIVLYGELRK